MPTNITSGGVAQNPQSYYGSESNYGNYQYITLDQIIKNFQAAYVGEGKILPGVLSGDVSFHAHRALQELSYDTLKSEKSLEIEVCPSLKVPLPHDYVNYVKLTFSDENGIERIIYPTRHSSNPFAIEQSTACVDCGDTSSTYNYDGVNLDEQQLACDAEEVLCEFDPLGSGMNDALHLGGLDVRQYLINQNGAPPANNSNAKKAYYGKWFGAIDAYCLCLENSGAEQNCGTKYTPANGWDNFFTNATGAVLSGGLSISQLNSSIQLHAGWTNLRNNANPGITYDMMLNGTWPSISTPGVVVSTQSSNTWEKFSGAPGSTADPEATLRGQRYGLEPEFAQSNGSFYIDNANGAIHFGSALSGKTIIIKYISDGLAASSNNPDISGDNHYVIPKLAEEAMYKWIAYGCASARVDVPQGVVQRLKQEKFAETRKAKIRLSNIKIEEISQVMRGKGKFIDH